MSVGSDPDLARVRDAESCREWLRTLPAEPGERLGAIGTLLARLSQPRVAGNVLFEVLEALRVAQLASIDKLVEPLVARPVPYSKPEWQILGSALASLRASRNLFKRAYASRVRAEIEDAGSTIPGASDSLEAVLPLVRALDAQARVVSLLLRHRSVPSAADWNELCVLARHVRRTSFQDEALPDEAPLVRPVTARALFVHPVLLECAGLAGRSISEASFAERLAARLAARVGYRIDPGAPRENTHGPRIALSADYAVRLDTHRVPSSLAQRRRQWLAPGEEEGAPLPALPLTTAALGALLDDLERRWTATGVPSSAGSHPAAAQPMRTVRLRFGLPRMYSADVRMKFGESSAARGAAGAARDPGRPAAARSQYDYGRWEQNTIMRLAMGGPSERVDPVGLLMAEGESATQLADRPDARVVIARHGAIPRAGLGSLVAIAGVAEGGASAARTGAKPASADLRLGAVEAIEQLPEYDGTGVQSHRLVVRCWSGGAVPVGVRVGDSAFFEDAWLLRGSGAGGELPCIVMAPGRAHGGAHGVLREGGSDMAIRFVCVLDRGAGHERLSMRVEAARA